MKLGIASTVPLLIEPAGQRFGFKGNRGVGSSFPLGWGLGEDFGGVETGDEGRKVTGGRQLADFGYHGIP